MISLYSFRIVRTATEFEHDIFYPLAVLMPPPNASEGEKLHIFHSFCKILCSRQEIMAVGKVSRRRE